jgi:hypothetical protein
LVITASVEWHLGVSFESVNIFLAKNGSKAENHRATPHLHALEAAPRAGLVEGTE